MKDLGKELLLQLGKRERWRKRETMTFSIKIQLRFGDPLEREPAELTPCPHSYPHIPPLAC